jgi:myo-inositol-1(or 4)-monophosphatase
MPIAQRSHEPYGKAPRSDLFQPEAPRMPVIALDRFLDELAQASGDVILPFFRSTLSVGDKTAGQGFDPVTEADRAAEMIIRKRIRQMFPEHGIIGEEFPPERPGAEYQWVIDPIDGTRAFICGLPIWGTLVGLMRGGAPVYGLMAQPFLKERFIGDGSRAFMRSAAGERPLRTRRCASLAEAMLATTSPKLFAGEDLAAYERAEAAVRQARYGTDCYAYAMLAAGNIDLVIESGLKPYDIVALIPIIEGAGGVITNWQGGSAAGGGRILAAGDRRVHEQALALLAG